MPRTMAVRVSGPILVIVHSDRPPPDAEWDEYVTALRDNAATLRYQLVWSAGGGPNAAQRKRAENSVSAAYLPVGRTIPLTAVVTRSAAVRGLVTLFNWFQPGRFRAFDAHDLRGALAFVDVPPTSVETHVAMIAAMCAEAGAPVPPG